jgi:DnaJ-class molecular chaperone
VAEDPYTVLGVTRDASNDDVRKAYRDLAKKHHPDLHPGDRASEDRFKAITAAYDILGDPEKRKRFDSGEIDASGAETHRRFYREYAEGAGEQPYYSSAGFEDLGDMFSDLFGQGRRGAGGGIRMQGGDVRYTMEVDFLEAANGARKRITMPDGHTLDVTIPEGIEDGRQLRLRGKGMPGIGGGPPGDAYVLVHVRPHRTFRRDGWTIHVDLPISLTEAVLGGKVQVPTIGGDVSLTIPEGANTGTTLRLREKGVRDPRTGKHGDQYVHLRVVLPDKPDNELEDFVRRWGESHPYDPRKGAGGHG